jgi:hypothetical protein
MKYKHPKHKDLMEEIFTAAPAEADVARRVARLREVMNWMKEYCKGKAWL